MRIEQTARVFPAWRWRWPCRRAAASCKRPMPAPTPGHDAGQDGGGVPCRQLGEAAAARAPTARSAPASLLRGRVELRQLLRPGDRDAAGVHRTAASLSGAVRSVTDEASCTARTDCRADYLSRLQRRQLRSPLLRRPERSARPVSGHRVPGAVRAGDDARTRATRAPTATPSSSTGACACAALGCCARFSRCADGTAVCTAPRDHLRRASKPYCEGPYVVSYSGSCYEGCVQRPTARVN